MSSDLATLREVLEGSSAKVKEKILAVTPVPLAKGEFRKLEAEILSLARETDDVTGLIDLLRATALQAGTPPEHVEEQRVATRYPTPANPFAGGLRDSEQQFLDAFAWLAASATWPKTPGLSFARFVVATIVEFRVLHADYVPAIVRSIREGRRFRIHNTIEAIPLSLNYGRQENAERRLLILRRQSLDLFRAFRNTTDASLYLDTLPIHGKTHAFLGAIERGATTAENRKGSCKPPVLEDLIKQVSRIAILHLPSVIVAHRSRQIVSHSLPPEMLGRISGHQLEPFAVTSRLLGGAAVVFDDVDVPEPVPMRDDPAWMEELRGALRPSGLNHAALDRIIIAGDDHAMLLARFAKHLEQADEFKLSKAKSKGCQPETVRRYCLLIGSKLFPRLSAPISEMTVEAWEDAIEQALDEDLFYNLRRYTAKPNSKAQTHSRPVVKALRHWLRFLAVIPQARTIMEEGGKAIRVKRLRELERSLPVLGLVEVDACLITVDEYKRALERLVGSGRSDGENEREAARVALILGYRCGLRRMEAAGLRLSDFDAIDFLHVTANAMRPLKTSNAKRDLPLALLMPKEELGDLKRRVKEVSRRARAQKLEDAYIFSPEDNPTATLDFDSVIAWIHKAFRGDPTRSWPVIDATFHFHRLRHSYCNLLLLKLSPDMARVFLHLLGGHPETRAWLGDSLFRSKLFGTELKGSDMQAVALLMGHGSAATSLEHYTHVLDFYEAPDRWDR